MGEKHGISSVGLFLGDGDSVKVTQLDAELGHVGLAQPGSPALINTLLAGGYLPVVSSIGVTDEGQLMNVNADQRRQRWRPPRGGSDPVV